MSYSTYSLLLLYQQDRKVNENFLNHPIMLCEILSSTQLVLPLVVVVVVVVCGGAATVSNAVVLPSRSPCSGSFVGRGLFAVVEVVFSTLGVRRSLIL